MKGFLLDVSGIWDFGSGFFYALVIRIFLASLEISCFQKYRNHPSHLSLYLNHRLES